MFNTYINKKTEYVPYEKTVTVNEHKAPTDESVRLLNEFQEEAKQNLLAKLHVNDNTFNHTALLFMNNPSILDEVQWIAKFQLNGKEIKLRGKMTHEEFTKRCEFHHLGKGYIIPDLFDKLGTEIAKYLICEFGVKQSVK